MVANNYTDIPLTQLKYCEFGDYAHVDTKNDYIEALAADIAADGIKKPLIVRPVGDLYEVVCGLKRWKAAIVAGLPSVPAEVRTLTDAEAAELSLQDNYS
tara:strand:- start:199 stop:498 length:300 start_codon:yes stop_codon:yes gene_type:complete